MGGITSQQWNIFGELVEVTNANGHTHRFTYDAANQLIQKVNANGDQTTYQYDLAGKFTKEITIAAGSATPSQIVTYLYNDAWQLVDVKQTGETNSHYQYSIDALGRTTEETITYGTGNEAITKKLGYDREGSELVIRPQAAFMKVI